MRTWWWWGSRFQMCTWSVTLAVAKFSFWSSSIELAFFLQLDALPLLVICSTACIRNIGIENGTQDAALCAGRKAVWGESWKWKACDASVNATDEIAVPFPFQKHIVIIIFSFRASPLSCQIPIDTIGIYMLCSVQSYLYNTIWAAWLIVWAHNAFMTDIHSQHFPLAFPHKACFCFCADSQSL